MENLQILRTYSKGRLAFVKKENKTKDYTYSHLPNKNLMELLNQIKEGDIHAIETLSAQYIHLIVDIANDFKGIGLTDIELILKGNDGLIKAAENYDASRGIDFNSYATWAIRQGIIKAIDQYELNKPIPLNKIGLLTPKKYWQPNREGEFGYLL